MELSSINKVSFVTCVNITFQAKQVGTKQIDEDGLFEMIRASQPTKSEEEFEPKEEVFNKKSPHHLQLLS